MKITQFLQEANGDFSSKRLFAFLMVLTFIVDWQHCIWTGVSFNPTWEVIGSVLGVTGYVTFGKKYEQPAN